MAIMMPVFVSPIFMVEVSTAVIVVSWWLGLSATGVCLRRRVDGYCCGVWNC